MLTVVHIFGESIEDLAGGSCVEEAHWRPYQCDSTIV